jgi:integration host factor subunit beta
MTKSDLIERVSVKVPHISKKDTETVVNTIFDCMTEALRKGDRIEIRGFGSFQVKVREAREGRNPKTGEEARFPPSARLSRSARSSRSASGQRSRRRRTGGPPSAGTGGRPA